MTHNMAQKGTEYSAKQAILFVISSRAGWHLQVSLQVAGYIDSAFLT